MNIVELLPEGRFREDLKRVGMMLPNRMPVIPAANLAAKFEQRLVKAVIFQIVDDAFGRNSIQQTKHLVHLPLRVGEKMSVIRHNYVRKQ